MNRIVAALERARDRQRKALALFLTAGFPSFDSTPDLAAALEDGGMDILEIGMPFSDPLADGPVIQKTSAVALANGVTLDSLLDDVRKIRRRSAIPIVLMGYLNPVLRYGAEKFFPAAAEAGVDGVILPEVPLEEHDRFSGPLERSALAAILLVTPISPAERIRAIDARSTGFLYCVASTGVTGRRGTTPMGEYLGHVRRNAPRNPLMVGFGISSPADAVACAQYADGVIIGSALLRQLSERRSPREATDWVRQFREALDAVPVLPAEGAG